MYEFLGLKWNIKIHYNEFRNVSTGFFWWILLICGERCFRYIKRYFCFNTLHIRGKKLVLAWNIFNGLPMSLLSINLLFRVKSAGYSHRKWSSDSFFELCWQLRRLVFKDIRSLSAWLLMIGLIDLWRWSWKSPF